LRNRNALSYTIKNVGSSVPVLLDYDPNNMVWEKFLKDDTMEVQGYSAGYLELFRVSFEKEECLYPGQFLARMNKQEKVI